MKALGHGARLDLAARTRRGDAALQADIQLRPGRGLGDIPHLGLGFAAQLRRLVGRRMDLQRELLLRVEDLDEQRKPRRLAAWLAPSSSAGVVLHEPTQVLARERAVGDDADVARPVADLPRLADRHAGRQAACGKGAPARARPRRAP